MSNSRAQIILNSRHRLATNATCRRLVAGLIGLWLTWPLILSIAHADEIRFSGVGRGATTAEALDQAYEVALRDFLMREFPTQVEVAEQFVHTLSGPRARGGTSVRSADVQIKGVRIIESRVRAEGQVQIAEVTYGISRRLFETARRTAAMKASVPLAQRLRENRDDIDEDPHRASLVVETEPPGALVHIKDLGFSVPTPTRLPHFLSPGRVQIRIDHPEYEPIEETHEVHAGQSLEIRRTLKRAQVTVKFESEPEGATIWINGTKRGRTPVFHTHRLGQDLRVELTHPQADPYEQNFVITREPPLQLIKVKMQYKPTYVHLLAPPRPAGRYFLKKTFSSATLTLNQPQELPAGTSEFCFQADRDRQAEDQELLKSTRCGSNCCQSVDLKPGLINYVSFHELQTPKLVSPASRIVQASTGTQIDALAVKPPPTPAPPSQLSSSLQSSSGGGRWEDFVNPEPHFHSRFLLTYEDTFTPIRNFDLLGYGLEVEWRPVRIFHFAGAAGGLDSNSRVNDHDVGPKNGVFIEGGFGLHTPRFSLAGTEHTLSVTWKRFERRGEFQLPDLVKWQQVGSADSLQWQILDEDCAWSLAVQANSPSESRGLIGRDSKQWRGGWGCSW